MLPMPDDPKPWWEIVGELSIWGFFGTMVATLASIFGLKRRHPQSDMNEMLAKAHSDNVGLLTQILAGQNQLGSKFDRTDSKLDELKGHTAASLEKIEGRLAILEGQRGIPQRP